MGIFGLTALMANLNTFETWFELKPLLSVHSTAWIILLKIHMIGTVNSHEKYMFFQYSIIEAKHMVLGVANPHAKNPSQYIASRKVI